MRPESWPRVTFGSGTVGRLSAQKIISAAEDQHPQSRPQIDVDPGRLVLDV